MPYPNTDWPVAVDAVIVRVDGADIVHDNDFNYPDEQVRTIQDWLGINGDLIGDDGTVRTVGALKGQHVVSSIRHPMLVSNNRTSSSSMSGFSFVYTPTQTASWGLMYPAANSMASRGELRPAARIL